MNKYTSLTISEKQAYNLKGKHCDFKLIKSIKIKGVEKSFLKGIVLDYSQSEFSFKNTPIDSITLFNKELGKIQLKTSNIKMIHHEK